MSGEADPGRRARSYGPLAETYDRGRPGYPAKAAVWLTSDQPVSVLELGAGTGKLTEQLVALGHGVHATDPDQAMVERLQRNVPGVLAKVGSAEQIDSPDSSFDVVVCAQSWHWFDHPRAIAEIVRVLKPGGRLSMVWNERNEQIPWVRKFGRLVGGQYGGVDPTDQLEQSMKFIMIEQQSFSHWHTIDRRSVVDLVTSLSHISTLDDDAREAKLAEVVEFYDGYGRGMDGMQLPYFARCFRARVVKRRDLERRAVVPESAAVDDEGDPATDPTPAPVSDPPTTDDTGTLLIDFK